MLETRKIDRAGFFNEEIELTITLNEEFEIFDDFKYIFDTLERTDIIYNQVVSEIYQREVYVKHGKRSKVVSVSKKSPLEIVTFIENHWYETLLFIITLVKARQQDIQSKRDNLKLQNLAEEQIILSKEMLAKLDELTGGDYERVEIERIQKWYHTLTETQKSKFDAKLRNAANPVSKITKIRRKKR